MFIWQWFSVESKIRQIMFYKWSKMARALSRTSVVYYEVCPRSRLTRGRKEMFYLTTHSTHFIYGYMASDKWQKTIQIAREETRCGHIRYSYRLTARVILYAPSHRQENTYHGLCYTSRGALAGTRNSSMGPHHEGSTRPPIAPWANALTMELHLASRGSPESVMTF